MVIEILLLHLFQQSITFFQEKPTPVPKSTYVYLMVIYYTILPKNHSLVFFSTCSCCHLGSPVWSTIFLFRLCRSIHLLARSQNSLASIFPSCCPSRIIQMSASHWRIRPKVVIDLYASWQNFANKDRFPWSVFLPRWFLPRYFLPRVLIIAAQTIRFHDADCLWIYTLCSWNIRADYASNKMANRQLKWLFPRVLRDGKRTINASGSIFCLRGH